MIETDSNWRDGSTSRPGSQKRAATPRRTALAHEAVHVNKTPIETGHALLDMPTGPREGTDVGRRGAAVLRPGARRDAAAAFHGYAPRMQAWGRPSIVASMALESKAAVAADGEHPCLNAASSRQLRETRD